MASHDGLRVLIIDDDAMVAKVLERSLDGARVQIALGGAQGLEQLASATFDIVLCDLQMPEVDGLAVLEHVERVWPALLPRLLFISGGAVTERARQVVERMNDQVIEKPIMPKALRERIARAARDAPSRA